MRVLYLIDSLGAGGAERSLEDLAPALVADGLSLDIACFRGGGAVEARLMERGIRIFQVAGAGRLRRARAVASLVRELRPDLIHTTLFEADLAGRSAGLLTRTPVVSSLVNLAYGPEQRADPGLSPAKVNAARAVDAATARGVRRFQALTQEVARVMGRRLLIPADRIEVIGRGRDPESLGRRTEVRSRAARVRLEAEEEDEIVLAAARQEFQKGLDVLIQAFARVAAERPRAVLVVAGRHGNQTPGLADAARRTGVGERIRFLGTRDDVADLMCAASAFVLPSRWEGFGSVLLEAMALEAPIVASDLPSVREVLDGDALYARPSDPHDLAGALVRLLSDPAAAASRAERARSRFLERFTSSAIAARTAAFYGRALVPQS